MNLKAICLLTLLLPGLLILSPLSGRAVLPDPITTGPVGPEQDPNYLALAVTKGADFPEYVRVKKHYGWLVNEYVSLTKFRSLAEELLAKSPPGDQTNSVLEMLARACVQMKNGKVGAEYAAKLIERLPDAPVGHALLGKAQALLGDYSGAEAAYTLAAERANGDERDWYQTLRHAQTYENPINPKDLWLDFQAKNMVAAARKYQGRVVALDGWVGVVQLDSHGNPVAFMSENGKLAPIYAACFFKKEHADDVVNISNFLRVVLVGEVGGLLPEKFVRLDNCRIIYRRHFIYEMNVNCGENAPLTRFDLLEITNSLIPDSPVHGDYTVSPSCGKNSNNRNAEYSVSISFEKGPIPDADARDIARVATFGLVSALEEKGADIADSGLLVNSSVVTKTGGRGKDGFEYNGYYEVNPRKLPHKFVWRRNDHNMNDTLFPETEAEFRERAAAYLEKIKAHKAP